jgi:hypothetical protein
MDRNYRGDTLNLEAAGKDMIHADSDKHGTTWEKQEVRLCE